MIKNELAPVVVFTYNRLEHTRKTIDALQKNKHAEKTHVYVFSDSAKDKSQVDRVRSVRSYLDSLEGNNRFRKYEVIHSDKNKGLAKSIIDGVTYVIEIYSKIIVLEDDIVTSIDFLDYMNKALNYYNDEKRIWSISGYTFKIRLPRTYRKDVYFVRRGCSWGWATWKDRWSLVDWDVKDYNQFINCKECINEFNIGGRDLSHMLKAQMEGRIDSWAIRWCYSQYKHDMYTVYPKYSKVVNIGIDNSGTHSRKKNMSKYKVKIDRKTSHWDFGKFEINKKIINTFQNFYIKKWQYFLRKIKRPFIGFL